MNNQKLLVSGNLNKKKGVFRKTHLYACVTEEKPHYLLIQKEKVQKRDTTSSQLHLENNYVLGGWERYDLRIFNVEASLDNETRFQLRCKHHECHLESKHEVALFATDTQTRNFWVARLNEIIKNLENPKLNLYKDAVRIIEKETISLSAKKEEISILYANLSSAKNGDNLKSIESLNHANLLLQGVISSLL